MIFQMSLGCWQNPLDPEERRRLSDFLAVAADDSENLDGDVALQQALLIVLELLVEEPLVNLDPGQAGHFYR
jgi:hypothetical protein